MKGEFIMKQFDEYTYGSIRARKYELHTSNDPSTSLKVMGAYGISLEGDDNTYVALIYDGGKCDYKLFTVDKDGFIFTGDVKEVTEDGQIYFEDGWNYNVKGLAFIGLIKE
jgi:hypothetical protein